MEKGRLMLVCAAGFAVSLLTVYFVALDFHVEKTDIGKVSFSVVGNVVKISGSVKEASIQKGNMFVKLEDKTGEIRVVLWSDTLEQMELSGMDVSGIRIGAKLEITGTVDSYKGKVQVAAFGSGVKILNKV